MDTCERLDFVTAEPCVLDKNHNSFHELENGTAFAIGYTIEDLAEWGVAPNGIR